MNATNATMTNANGAKAIKTSHFEFHNFKQMSQTSSARPEHYSLAINHRYGIKLLHVISKTESVAQNVNFLIKGEGALTVVQFTRFRNNHILTYGTINSPPSQTLSNSFGISARHYFVWLMCCFNALMRNIVLGVQILNVWDSSIGSKKYNPYYICLTKKYWKRTKLQHKKISFKLMIISNFMANIITLITCSYCAGKIYNLTI